MAEPSVALHAHSLLYCLHLADYPYPNDEKGKPIDTPEWRDPSRIDYHAPKPHEKTAPDNDLFKAIRSINDAGMGPIEAAIFAGADINAQDKLGYTPLHLAIKNMQPELTHKLMTMKGIQLNIQTKKGFTPMHVAAWKGDVATVQALIKCGADIAARDTAGRNVWGIAHDWHKEDVLELLKRNDFHYALGDVIAFPPHPKWLPENRGKM